MKLTRVKEIPAGHRLEIRSELRTIAENMLRTGTKYAKIEGVEVFDHEFPSKNSMYAYIYSFFRDHYSDELQFMKRYGDYYLANLTVENND